MVQMFLMLIIMLCMNSRGIKSVNGGPLWTTVYFFGDSLFDDLNYMLPTVSTENDPSFGMNFERWPTTLRFINGRTVSDILGEYLGLPQPQLLKGLNYASAACGILPLTAKQLGTCLNLAQQINSFERTVNKELQRHYKNSDELSNNLSKSVFIISTGNNDYINNYLRNFLNDTNKHHTLQYFANRLIANLSRQLKRLYRLGARIVIVFELGPIPCNPMRVTNYKQLVMCDEMLKQFAVAINGRLVSMLQNLTSTHEGSTFVLGRVSSLGDDAIVVDPSNFSSSISP